LTFPVSLPSSHRASHTPAHGCPVPKIGLGGRLIRCPGIVDVSQRCYIFGWIPVLMTVSWTMISSGCRREYILLVILCGQRAASVAQLFVFQTRQRDDLQERRQSSGGVAAAFGPTFFLSTAAELRSINLHGEHLVCSLHPDLVW
jgi:hypothetical protein